jgi:hypothetical protein
MDWYTIEFLYPESFDRFAKTMFPNVGLISTYTLSHFDVKKLYNFFDKEGIFLHLEMYSLHRWAYSISLDCGTVLCPSTEIKSSRTEVEYDGFYDCFRLLDKKIRDKL